MSHVPLSGNWLDPIGCLATCFISILAFLLPYSPSTHPYSPITMAYQGREAIFTDKAYSEPNPLPSNIPQVDELGTTSAPLKSASFFIGDHCKAVNGGLFLRLMCMDTTHT